MNDQFNENIENPGESANEIPAAQPEISISYVLKQDEVYRALRDAKMFKSVGKGQWIRSGLLVIVIAISIYNIFLDHSYLGMGLFLILLSIALIAAIWVIPEMSMRGRAREEADGTEIHVELCSDRIQMLKMTDDLKEWASREAQVRQEDVHFEKYYRVIPYDSISAEEFETYYLIHLGKSQIFVIPKRAIPTEDQTKVQILLRSAMTGDAKKAENKKER